MKHLVSKVYFHLKKWWFIWLYLLVYLVAINLVVLHRWWQLEIYYFDHGIFDQALWHASKFNTPIIDHLKPEFINQLGDHFTPSLYLLSPIYWLTGAYEVLFIVQNFFVVAAAAVMFFISEKLLKSKSLILALLIGFTLFVGLQNGLIAGFHTELPALLSLALAFYFFEKRSLGYFWVFVLITLGLKETFTPLIISLGIFLIFNREYWHGLLMIIFSLAYSVMVTQYITPYISGYPYLYVPEIPANPTDLITGFFDSATKIETITYSFLQFGLLPILGWQLWPAILQDFASRFVLAPSSHSADLGMHYSIMSALILYYSAIKGAVVLEKKTNKTFTIVLAIIIIVTSLILHWRLRGPLGLAYNPAFFQHTQNTKFLRDFTDFIPNQGLVMTQNNFAPRLTHTHQVMLLREDYWNHMPDVIAIDIREGQNPNNYWPVRNIDQLYQRLASDPNYHLTEHTRDQIIFVNSGKQDMDYYLQFIKPNKRSNN